MIHLNNILQSAFQFPQSIVFLSVFVENTCCLSSPAIYGLACTLLIRLVSSVGANAAYRSGVYEETQREKVNGCVV
jgi:hypothetical protein